MPAVNRLRLPLVVLVATAITTTALAQEGNDPSTGRIGPETKVQPNGRKLSPAGKLTAVGNHPGGGALTTNGRFLWVLAAGRGLNDIRIVDAAPELACKKGTKGAKCRSKASKRKTGKVVQTIPMPGVTGGIAMAPDGRTAYVSGIADSEHLDQKAPPDTPGLEGDVIHVFTYSAKDGTATRAGTIPVPPPNGVPAPQVIPGGVAVGTPQSFPPTGTKPLSWPRDLAVSQDGGTVLAALNLADRAAIIDTKTKAVRYVTVGSYPYGAAITRKGKGLVSNESDGTVSVIDLKSGQKEKDITVGKHLSHPEGIAVDPKAERAYVAVASDDRIAVIDTAKMEVERKLSVERSAGIGSQPVALSVTADGCRLMSSDSGEDAVAIFALKPGCDTKRAKPAKKKHKKKGKKGHRRRHAHQQGPSFAGKRQAELAKAKQFQLLGRVPTAAYPVFAGATPKRQDLVWVAAKGLGTGANPNGPNPLSPNDSDDHINSFQYLPSIVSGLAGTALFPTDKELLKLSKRANAQVRPSNPAPAPSGTPLKAGGPIKHVFYIVRENRTYDQILGDDARGDGDPNLTVFGQNLTPNAHLLAQRFPLLD